MKMKNLLEVKILVGGTSADQNESQNESQKIFDLFRKEYPDFDKTLIKDRPHTTSEDEAMITMRALRDLIKKSRLNYGESILRQVLPMVLKYYRNTDTYVSDDNKPWWKK